MNSQMLFVGFAVISASFLGSWHCAAMCSPVASLMAQKRSLWSYHLGRCISYVFLGAIGGYLGSFFLTNDLYRVRLYSGIVFAAILIFLGIQTFLGKNLKLYSSLKWFHSFYTPQKAGISLGLLSVFLPCGWLYSYILASAATQSPYGGAAFMFLFWLGGLPALSSISLFMGKSIAIAPKKKQLLASAVLVLAGLYSLLSFYFMSSHC